MFAWTKKKSKLQVLKAQLHVIYTIKLSGEKRTDILMNM